MDKDTKPAAKAPRKKADVWAADKAIPLWLFNAASTVAKLSVGTDWSADEMTEAEFDAAIDRAR